MSDYDVITLSVAGDMNESDGTYKRHICVAASTGDWVKASLYDETHPNWVSTPLTEDGDTALHIAVSMERISFVAKLVERTSIQDMEIRNADENTAFCVAAISGNVEIARVLFGKNSRLVWIRGHEEMLPIQLASLAGHFHMVKFLFEGTQQDADNNLPFQDAVNLFFLTLTSNIYSNPTVALKLLDTYPKLASTENEKGLTALQALARSPRHEHAPDYPDMLSSLFKGMEEEKSLQSAKTSAAMFDAAKSGNFMILEYIFNHHPNLLKKVNSQGQSLLHIAILYRQKSVYDLILSKGAYKNVLMQHVDYEGNNVLHLAGKLAAEERFESLIPLIDGEEYWFERVEKIVPLALKTMENREGLTQKKIFHREHKQLYEKALSELNEMANTFLVVTTLYITLGITGVLTIRTIDVIEQTPIFKQEIWYIIFFLSVGVGVCLCSISMFLFASAILPSPSGPKRGYVNSRFVRMICGCLLLLVSIGIMGTFSNAAGAILIFSFFPKWIFYVVGPVLCGLPIISLYILYRHYLNLSLEEIRDFCQHYAGPSRMKINFK